MNKHIRPSTFPTDQFYGGVESAIEEVRDTIQSPDAMIATSFLTAMSIACQADIDMMLPIGSTTPCALFLATIADSGERKTATDNLILKPIYENERRQAVAYDTALARSRTERRRWNLIESALGDTKKKLTLDDLNQLCERHDVHFSAEPVEPTRRRALLRNTTERALIKAVQGHSRSIALITDEGDTFVKSGAAQGLGTLNKLWDGPSMTSLEVKNEKEIVEAYDPRLTLSFMIQERPFQNFLNNQDRLVRASGFLARFLLCHPESTQGYRLTKNRLDMEEPQHPALDNFHNRVTELLNARQSRLAAGDLGKKLLRFSTDAKALWVRTQNLIEPELAKGGMYHSVRDFVSKSMEIASRVAGIFHHFEGVEGNVVERATLERALIIVDFYLGEFQKKFGNHNNLPEDEKDACALMTYLRSHYWERGRDQAGRNDVRKCGPIRHQGRFTAALALLEEEGAIRVCHESSFQRKGRLLIRLHPVSFGARGIL